MKWPRLRPYAEAIASIPSNQFLTIEGQRIHITDQGEGPVLLLLHGLVASSYSFRDLIPLLEDSFRVITIDLNGFGLTERPRDLAEYQLSHQAERIAQVLQRLQLSELSILGHSYGAPVAAMVAKRFPTLVQKLILVSPATSFDPLPWYLKFRLGKELLYHFSCFLLSNPARYRRIAGKAFHVPGVFNEAVAEEYRQRLLIEGLHSTWMGFLEMLRDPFFPQLAYEGLSTPVLILTGDHDTIVPLEKCRALAERLSNAPLVVLPDCGHSAPEEYPEQVAELLRSDLGISSPQE